MVRIRKKLTSRDRIHGNVDSFFTNIIPANEHPSGKGSISDDTHIAGNMIKYLLVQEAH